jgi:hypothetical protein
VPNEYDGRQSIHEEASKRALDIRGDDETAASSREDSSADGSS